MGVLALVMCKAWHLPGLNSIEFPNVGVGPNLSGVGLSLQGGLWSGIPQCRLRKGGLGAVHYQEDR